MKNASSAVLAILNTTGEVKVLRSDLYTITLKNGSVYRFTDADHNQIVGGNTFLSGPIMTRSKTKQTIGVTVDSVQVTLSDNGSTLINSKPIIHQIKNGVFKGAHIKIQKLYLLDWNDTSPGPVDWHEGTFSSPSCDHISASFEVKSLVEILNQQMPRDVYQPTCGNDLYDSTCGASAAAFTFSGTATGTITRSKFTLAGTSQANAYFALGKVWFTSGQNAGQAPRTVKSYIGGVIEVFQPFPYDINSGDACTARAGCDKLQATCGDKFNRLDTGFKAQPYVPVPETAVEGGGVGGSVSGSGSTGGVFAGSSGTAGKRPGTYTP